MVLFTCSGYFVYKNHGCNLQLSFMSRCQEVKVYKQVFFNQDFTKAKIRLCTYIYKFI